jgi:RNase P subunit RPR2
MVSFSPSQHDYPPVLCPGCEHPMMRGAAQPIMFTTGLSDVVYTCETCNTESVRTVKSDGSPHSAAGVGDKA